ASLAGRRVELRGGGLARLGEDVPAPLRGRDTTARAIAGAALALANRWLLDTEQQAADGEALDATELLETLLRTAPPWYTGLAPQDPVPAAELMEACRAARSAESD